MMMGRDPLRLTFKLLCLLKSDDNTRLWSYDRIWLIHVAQTIVRMISGDLPSCYKYYWSRYTSHQSSVRQIDQFMPSFIAQISNSRTIDDNCFIRKYFHTLPSFPLSVCYLFLECRMQITNWGGLQTGIANAIRRLKYIVVGLRGRYVQVRFL